MVELHHGTSHVVCPEALLPRRILVLAILWILSGENDVEQLFCGKLFAACLFDKILAPLSSC
jgi:hypothetical protein